MEDLAIAYARRLRASQHPKVDVVGIASEILALKHGGTRKPLSLSDRERLVQLVSVDVNDQRWHAAAGTFAGRSCAKVAPTIHPQLGRVQKHLIAVTIDRDRILEWLPLFDAADMVNQVECSNGIESNRVSVTLLRAAQDSRSATVVMEALVRI